MRLLANNLTRGDCNGFAVSSINRTKKKANKMLYGVFSNVKRCRGKLKTFSCKGCKPKNEQFDVKTNKPTNNRKQNQTKTKNEKNSNNNKKKRGRNCSSGDQ